MDDLKSFLNDVYKWQDETFKTATSLSKLYHLKKEINELIEAVEKDERLAFASEYADCFLLLFGAARKDGLESEDILKVMILKQEINKRRKWGEADENGVVEHISEVT